jgi:hypothetical protein
MKKKEGKVLKAKLIAAVKKVLKENNSLLTVKIEKVVNRSVKKIIKKSSGKILTSKKPLAAKHAS